MFPDQHRIGTVLQRSKCRTLRSIVVLLLNRTTVDQKYPCYLYQLFVILWTSYGPVLWAGISSCKQTGTDDLGSGNLALVELGHAEINVV
jgi:hypothetical protein